MRWWWRWEVGGGLWRGSVPHSTASEPAHEGGERGAKLAEAKRQQHKERGERGMYSLGKDRRTRTEAAAR